MATIKKMMKAAIAAVVTFSEAGVVATKLGLKESAATELEQAVTVVGASIRRTTEADGVHRNLGNLGSFIGAAHYTTKCGEIEGYTDITSPE